MREWSWAIPNHWERETLGDVASWASGGTPKATEPKYYGGGIPWLVIGDLNDGIVTNSNKTITDIGLKESSAKYVEPGSIMVAMYGSIGKLGIAGFRCTTNQAIAFTRSISEDVEPKFLFHYLASVRDLLLAEGKGGAQANISQTVLKGISFCYPDKTEQRRIVAKLDQITARIDEAKARLDTIPTTLKRFRQSILAAACSGRLTADWRTKNQNVEWSETTLGELTSLITSGSRGWAKFYSDSGAIFIRAQNINTDELILDDVAFVRVTSSAEGARTRVTKNDLLITITGANVTKTALVTCKLDEAYVSQHVALVRLVDVAHAPFVFLWLSNGAPGRLQLLDSAYGAGKPGLNLGNIRDVQIRLPSPEEQTEIVRRVEALFKQADAIEARYKTARAFVEKLTPAVLAKAFRGELV